MKMITKNLKKLQGGKTLRAFSDKCGIGQSTMHNYLKGRDIKGDMIIKICKAHPGCTADALLGLKKESINDASMKFHALKMHVQKQDKENVEFLKELGV